MEPNPINPSPVLKAELEQPALSTQSVPSLSVELAYLIQAVAIQQFAQYAFNVESVQQEIKFLNVTIQSLTLRIVLEFFSQKLQENIEEEQRSKPSKEAARREKLQKLKLAILSAELQKHLLAREICKGFLKEASKKLTDLFLNSRNAALKAAAESTETHRYGKPETVLPSETKQK